MSENNKEFEKKEDAKITNLVINYVTASVFATAHAALKKGWLTEEQVVTLTTNTETVNTIMETVETIVISGLFNEDSDEKK